MGYLWTLYYLHNNSVNLKLLKWKKPHKHPFFSWPNFLYQIPLHFFSSLCIETQKICIYCLISVLSLPLKIILLQSGISLLHYTENAFVKVTSDLCVDLHVVKANGCLTHQPYLTYLIKPFSPDFQVTMSPWFPLTQFTALSQYPWLVSKLLMLEGSELSS